MRIVRKISKFFFGTLFSILLTISIVSFFMIKLMSHDYLESAVIPIIQSQYLKNINQQRINLTYQFLLSECKTKDIIKQSSGGFNFSIKCDTLKKYSSQNFTKLLLESFFDQLYYKNYTCQKLDCFKNPTYLISFSFYQQVQKSLKWLIIFTVIIGIAYLLSMETWVERLNGFGMTFLFTGISYVFLLYFEKIVPSSVKIFTSSLTSVFEPLIYFLVLGVFMVISSQILKVKSKKKKRH